MPGEMSFEPTIRESAVKAGGSAARGLAFLTAVVAVMWVVLAINWISAGSLTGLGVFPRTATGLRGVLFAPFLHVNTAHLAANSLPFLALGWLVILGGQRSFAAVTAWSMAGAGMCAWILGKAGSVHIGASGVIFGYLGYLLLSGFYRRNVVSIGVAVVVMAVWGGLVMGVLPGTAGVSWQSHLGGFIGGWLAARASKPRESGLI